MAEPTTKPKSKAVPRKERVKRVDPPSNEQRALIREIAALARSEQEKYKLSTKQTGIIINREPKTMEADRRKQRALLAAKKKSKQTGEKAVEIDLTHPMSLPYVPPTGDEREVQYFASDIVDYLDRLYATVDRSFLKRGAAPSTDPRMRGFQSWLSFGSPADTWPFCIQPDGRPLDMAEAIATGRLNDDIERLNLREFSTRLADAASRGASSEEARAIRVATPKAKRNASDPAPLNERKQRWTKPSGPI